MWDKTLEKIFRNWRLENAFRAEAGIKKITFRVYLRKII